MRKRHYEDNFVEQSPATLQSAGNMVIMLAGACHHDSPEVTSNCLYLTQVLAMQLLLGLILFLQDSVSEDHPNYEEQSFKTAATVWEETMMEDEQE